MQLILEGQKICRVLIQRITEKVLNINYKHVCKFPTKYIKYINAILYQDFSSKDH